jgi:hypothetical protein
MGMKPKDFFLKKKSKWPTQKTESYKTANFQYFLTKISWIGPWVSRIN